MQCQPMLLAHWLAAECEQVPAAWHSMMMSLWKHNCELELQALLSCRAALESERVSSMLHHWVDVTFGYKLMGNAAVAAKNVALAGAASGSNCVKGRAQLFTKPHPARVSISVPVSASLGHFISTALLSHNG